MLFLGGFILKPTEHRFFLKTVLGIFKAALLSRHPQVLMRQALEILNIFNASNSKNYFWKVRAFSKKLEHPLYLKVLRLETPHFDTKPPFENLTLRQI